MVDQDAQVAAIRAAFAALKSESMEEVKKYGVDDNDVLVKSIIQNIPGDDHDDLKAVMTNITEGRYYKQIQLLSSKPGSLIPVAHKLVVKTRKTINNLIAGERQFRVAKRIKPLMEVAIKDQVVMVAEVHNILVLSLKIIYYSLI